MRTYFVCTEAVIHPLDRSVLIDIGEVVPMHNIELMGEEFGMDNVQGYVILAENWSRAADIGEQLVQRVSFHSLEVPL